MNMTMNDDDTNDIGSPFPNTPFLARYHSVTGPLCIVSRISGINPPVYKAMFLQGTGGPALGDVLTLDINQLRKEYLPIRHSITLKNDWGTP